MGADPPAVIDLVLLGGGHSHVQVLRRLGMRPLPGVRATIVSREVFTPYSGMLPGHVAGRYAWRDIHIDLGPLSSFAGARLIADEVVAVDPEVGQLALAGHPPLRYDLLSVNCGAEPQAAGNAGIAVKPIGKFLPHWHAVRERVRPGDRVALVGGGPGGVELALAMRAVLAPEVEITLLTDALLEGLPRGAAEHLRRAVTARGMAVLEDFHVAASARTATGTVVTSEDGRRHEASYLFWVTGVAPPAWVAPSGLATDAAGFIAVDRFLRSTSHPKVFAAGDVAAIVGAPRPKSGVYAVRQGPVLADNLRRSIVGRPLSAHHPQRRALAIIGTADGKAVATRGPWWIAGRWVWHWKDRIDRRFMARFNHLPDMSEPAPALPPVLRQRLPETMRCGGCGAKLGADPLRRVLARLPDQRTFEQAQGVVLGIGDDAAVVRAGPGNLLMTVDGFRSLVDDPYRFGRITAHHSLNDVLAMGGAGMTALAMATVPLMTEAMMESELYWLLAGAVAVLNEHGVALVGGHSAEGSELSLALTIVGRQTGAALSKGGARPGDVLLLGKALGTGAVLAAQMRGQAASDAVDAALRSMDRSNAPALDVLQRHGVTALTDVSGFGLLGHLGEMLRAGGTGAAVCLDRVPLLPGAADVVRRGIVSSLQDNNELALRDFDHGSLEAREPRLRLLCDPQTSGGLLATVPWEQAEPCLAGLLDAGYADAAIIGRITEAGWRVTA